MARTNNLTDFLTDVADAIREKKGTQETIQASDFDAEIENLPSGADLHDYFGSIISNGSANASGLNQTIKTIPDFFTIRGNSAKYMFNSCITLTSIPQLDTQNVTNMQDMFRGCFSLTTIPLLNTQNVTNMKTMFSGCSHLISIPQLNTQNVTSMQAMFTGCTNLTTIPVLNTSKVTNVENLFGGCTSLSDNSLDNILQMCINATSYAGTKTLVQLGFTETNYSTSRMQALPHYQDFIDAGWTIGY